VDVDRSALRVLVVAARRTRGRAGYADPPMLISTEVQFVPRERISRLVDSF
jgi:hypothetical protein